MPLLDHFFPPLAPTHSWESFHQRWANAIADMLDRTLPGRYFAEVHVAAASRVEAEFIEEVEIQVIDQRGSARLVGAIEIISPANKDREEHRDAFTAKCSTYLHRGIGLVIIDTVTARKPNHHEELMQRLRHSRPEAHIDS